MSYIFKERPKTALPSTIELPEINRHALPGGELLHVLNTDSSSLIQLEIRFKAGSWHQDFPFQALITGKMLSEGTKNYTANALAETIDFYGGYYAIGVDKDNSTAQFVFPKIYLDKVLPVISEMLFESIFPDKEFDIVRDNLTHQIKMDDQRGDVIANKKMFSVIFGENHPYGRVGLPEQVNEINKKMAIDFYHRNYQSQPSEIFIAGDINEMDIRLIGQYLSPIRTINEIKPFEHKIESTIHPEIVIHREQSTQASIRIGKLMFNQFHPDYIPLHVASCVLGGYFGSRLMSNLREDKGFTYGVGSYLISYQHSGFFGISTEVSLEHCDAAINEIYKELQLLHQNTILEDELNRVKNYLIGNYLKSFDGPFNIMGQYTSIITKGLGINYPQQYLDVIKSINATDIKAMINKHLKTEELSRIVVKNTNNNKR